MWNLEKKNHHLPPLYDNNDQIQSILYKKKHYFSHWIFHIYTPEWNLKWLNGSRAICLYGKTTSDRMYKICNQLEKSREIFKRRRIKAIFINWNYRYVKQNELSNFYKDKRASFESANLHLRQNLRNQTQNDK